MSSCMIMLCHFVFRSVRRIEALFGKLRVLRFPLRSSHRTKSIGGSLVPGSSANIDALNTSPRLRKVSALSLSPLSLPAALKRQSKSQSFPGCQRLEAQNWNVESLQDFKPSFLRSNLYIARERSFHKAGNDKEFHQTSRSNSSLTKKGTKFQESDQENRVVA